MKTRHATLTTTLVALCLCAGAPGAGESLRLTYPIVDTAQVRCYDNVAEIGYPGRSDAFFGYSGNQPAYRDNDDGTVTDLNTGLM